MAYLTVAVMAEDSWLAMRVAACAAQENVPGDPTLWAYTQRLTWAASPGWSQSWESAQAADPPPAEPTPDWVPYGKRPDVITDSMILSTVQGMILPGPVADDG